MTFNYSKSHVVYISRIFKFIAESYFEISPKLQESVYNNNQYNSKGRQNRQKKIQGGTMELVGAGYCNLLIGKI